MGIESIILTVRSNWIVWNLLKDDEMRTYLRIWFLRYYDYEELVCLMWNCLGRIVCCMIVK